MARGQPHPSKDTLLEKEKLNEIVKMGQDLGFDSDIPTIRAEIEVEAVELTIEEVIEIDENSADNHQNNQHNNTLFLESRGSKCMNWTQLAVFYYNSTMFLTVTAAEGIITKSELR